MRCLQSFAAIGLLMMAATPAYRTEVEKWRQSYEDALRAPNGWLSVAGLSWLHEGDNTVGSDAANDVVLPKRFPPHTGTLTLSGTAAILRSAAGEQNLNAEKDPVALDDVSLALIERNHRYAIRLRDPQAESRAQFSGTKWFPLAESYRMTARWIAYDPPHVIAIMTILGYAEQQQIPGYAEFELRGQTFRLEPIQEAPDELFFIFRDQTAGHETYGAGRFLKAALPKDGAVTLDFNYAYNPPCAYTAYATCPLPPKQNQLPIRVEAGELKYGAH